jgi:large conductance mechanosensitive channel
MRCIFSAGRATGLHQVALGLMGYHRAYVRGMSRSVCLAIRRLPVKDIANEFKAFILRGNVIDLAIAVVIGAAFGAVITAFTTDIISPLLAAFGGKPDFSKEWILTVNGGKFLFGAFVTAIINFVILAAIIFFFVVKPINTLMSRRKQELPPDPTTRECPYCLSEIPIKATRCAFCTQEVPAVAAAAS